MTTGTIPTLVVDARKHLHDESAEETLCLDRNSLESKYIRVRSALRAGEDITNGSGGTGAIPTKP